MIELDEGDNDLKELLEPVLRTYKSERIALGDTMERLSKSKTFSSYFKEAAGQEYWERLKKVRKFLESNKMLESSGRRPRLFRRLCPCLFRRRSSRAHDFPKLGSWRSDWALYIVFAMIGSAYGGLHLLAWDAPFRTYAEQFLWRFSSLIIALTGVMVPASSIFWKIQEIAMSGLWEKVFLWLGRAYKLLYFVTVTIFIMAYPLARTYLVVECFINLAYLPSAAYQLPIWSAYIPHVT